MKFEITKERIMKLVKNDMYLLLIDDEAEILCRYKEILLSKDESLLCRITETNYKQHFRGINIVSNVEVAISYHQTNDFYKVIAYHPLSKEAKELDLPLLPLVGLETEEGKIIDVAFRSSWGMMWKNNLAPFLPDDTKVYTLDNSPQGIYTIKDIKDEIQNQREFI